ncbi:DNA repair protein RecO [uncultured Bartonella sp.]|uniref:DNA repair protein RecO n=1 Tax=uncultured Bartonella sp. TaxID=104108 RepID=UPI0026370521|nr:DNA repair protein RecO [uncultured Bartonella sp.]
MEWKEQAFILGTRQHGETSAIVEVITRLHGRHMGLVKGGRSRKMSAVLQPGNRVVAEWWARLDEHLGLFRFEPLDFNASRIMLEPHALYALQLAAAHIRLLPERDPYPALYDIFELLVANLENRLVTGELMVRFEMRLLEAMGFGLDLSRCGATGTHENLTYVSPKTARAICAEAGEPWKDKLLALPEFLLKKTGRPKDFEDIQNGFVLTGYFLMRNVWNARGIEPPEVRDGFIHSLAHFLNN